MEGLNTKLAQTTDEHNCSCAHMALGNRTKNKNCCLVLLFCLMIVDTLFLKIHLQKKINKT